MEGEHGRERQAERVGDRTTGLPVGRRRGVERQGCAERLDRGPQRVEKASGDVASGDGTAGMGAGGMPAAAAVPEYSRM